eukprot:Gregarina_sp_Poly_1__10382@NODE_744_length_6481_cov_177_190833_g555_i0_p2_GENE_NODE_744_length_6481_cov_177_190833_g555_i0NODE_744_length_6481_cov_177_190833_g555_i0_p2_ORF_typecomplete_len261_score28_39_NODE_744_length_6481_cov_177_190833_g555_i056826464
MILAVECSGKNQCRTGIAAAAIACSFQSCREDGGPVLVENRPTAPDQLNEFEPQFSHWHDVEIAEHLKSPFVCANEALLRFKKNPSYYERAQGEGEGNFCQRMMPPLRALMANEGMVYKIISRTKGNLRNGTSSPFAFLKQPGFQDLIHQYFKSEESKSELLSKLGVKTEKELFENTCLPSRDLIMWALDRTSEINDHRFIRRFINQMYHSWMRSPEVPLNWIPSHIEKMQKCIFNLLCVCHSRDHRELKSKLYIDPKKY